MSGPDGSGGGVTAARCGSEHSGLKFKSLFLRSTRQPAVVPAVVLTSILAVIATLWASHPGRALQQSRDTLGASLAEGLAALAVEPLQRQDRLHMSVIANRLLTHPQVRSVAIYDDQDALFALTGERGGALSYTHPVTADAAVLGYARVTLAAAAPWPPGSLWAVLLGVALLAPLLALAAVLALPVAWRRWQAWLSSRAAPPEGQEADADGGDGEPALSDLQEVEAPPPHFLLVVNLYNQLMLQPAVLDAELALARDLAGRVTGVHGGTVSPLPGTGLALEFDTAGNDRAFQCVCAGLVLKRLLDGTESLGEYRLSLHSSGHAEPLCLTLDASALADACLLSAMARGPGLVLSREALAEVERPQRLQLDELDSPVLEQLEASAGAVRVVDVGPSHRALLARQIARLQLQDSADAPGAAASESTF